MQNKEMTLALIKPDAVAAKHTGDIIKMIENAGFEIICMQKGQIERDMAEEFYAVHKARPFYGELVDFISSGPLVAMALEKTGAVKEWRDLMGATNPADAESNTVRKLYGTSIGNNAVHGSDSLENALNELELFFPELIEDEDDDFFSEESDSCCDDEDENCCG